MTIAQEISEKYMEEVAQDETGFNEMSPYAFLKKEGIKYKTIEEHCPQSCDSSVTVQFEDGSQAYMDNPAQEVYCGHIDIRKDAI